MTVIGIYDFRRLETETPMIGVYLVATGQHIGTIIKVPHEIGWTIAPGSDMGSQVYLDEISAADALREARDGSSKTQFSYEEL